MSNYFFCSKLISQTLEAITQLFYLKEFEPQLHLPLAERIVSQYGQTTYWLRTTDFVNRRGDYEIGPYSVDHCGRLSFFALGFHPKLWIAHRSDLKRSGEEINSLMIVYEKEKVKRVLKYIEKGIHFTENCSYYFPFTVWEFKVS